MAHSQLVAARLVGGALALLLVAACGARTELAAAGGAGGGGGSPAGPGGGGEGGEPPVPLTCGDGIVQPPEACDSPDPVQCTPECRLPRCGDGFLQPGVEACDLGDANEDRPAIQLINDGFDEPVAVLPVVGPEGPLAFYSYSSESAHTGFEGVFSSVLFLYQAAGASGIHLFTIHGIDFEATGEDSGDCELFQTLSGVPSQATLGFADDNPNEFFVDDGTYVGNWSFHHNSDGGLILDIPFPGSWVIEIESEIAECTDAWEFVDAGGFRGLVEPTAVLMAHDTPSPCRTDCSVPFCGDGVLDGGEVCDDGNNQSFDGCTADCSSTEG